MKKVVILGCENSHANNFLKFIKNRPEFSNIEIVGVYSDEEAPPKKLSEEYGVPVMQTYDEAVGKVDGVIITARHGKNHYKYALPYIKTGVPMFIDKPITVDEDEAITMMQDFKANGIQFSGGSSIKHADYIMRLKEAAKNNQDGETVGGFMRAPIVTDSPYGKFTFYAQHLIEMVLEVFGRFPKSVIAHSCEKSISVIFRYEDYDINGLYADNVWQYNALRIAKNGSQIEAAVPVDESAYREFKEYYDILMGEKSKIDPREFISPVFVMNAIMRSLESGKEEAIHEIIL